MIGVLMRLPLTVLTNTSNSKRTAHYEPHITNFMFSTHQLFTALCFQNFFSFYIFMECTYGLSCKKKSSIICDTVHVLKMNPTMIHRPALRLHSCTEVRMATPIIILPKNIQRLCIRLGTLPPLPSPIYRTKLANTRGIFIDFGYFLKMPMVNKTRGKWDFFFFTTATARVFIVYWLLGGLASDPGGRWALIWGAGISLKWILSGNGNTGNHLESTTNHYSNRLFLKWNSSFTMRKGTGRKSNWVTGFYA